LDFSRFSFSFTTIHFMTPWAVALVVFFIFFSTMAPTVSFWDCGEYIATASTLGINHPPGNPLYVLVGRIFTIIFFSMEQVAARVNLLSVVSGALTAFLVYKIITQVVIEFAGFPNTWWQKQALISSGVVGSFFSVLNYTYWASAVEASVYAPSLLMLVISFYLVLRWSQSKDKNRDRFLICAIYISFLGIGFHFFSILALPSLFFYVIVSDQSRRQDVCFWLVMFILSSVAFAASTFVCVSPLLLVVCGVYRFIGRKFARPINCFLSVAALLISLKLSSHSLISTSPYVALLLIVLGDLFFSTNDTHKKKHWNFLFLLTFAAVLGFSVFYTIPIRSALQPVVDHGHPVVTWEQGKPGMKAFGEHLDRSMYVSESMLTRMLHRRGSLFHQFGFEERIGYLGFHLTQYFHFGDTISQDRSAGKKNNILGGSLPNRFFYVFIYFLPICLTVWGIFFWARREKEKTLLLVSMVLISSIGMIFYLNFSDGTRFSEPRKANGWQQHGVYSQESEPSLKPTLIKRELRVRDYFFIPAFVFWNIWVGLTIAALLYKMDHSSRGAVRKAGIVLSYLFLMLPIVPFLSNYKSCNQAGNWTTNDYAYNMLMSCDEDGILFVDGDDMYAFWTLQETEGIRKDVSVISFGLLRREWYIRQLIKRVPRVPIAISEPEVDIVMRGKNYQNTKKMEMELPKSKLKVLIPGKQTKKTLLIQNEIFLNILDETNFSRPIYFPINVRTQYLLGLKPYLTIEGMVYKLTKHPVRKNTGININMERSKYLMDHVYQYRNFDRESMIFGDAEKILLKNMTAPFVFYNQALYNQITGAQQTINRYQTILDEKTPSDTATIEKKISDLQLFIKKGLEEIDIVFKRCLSIMPDNLYARKVYHLFLVNNQRWDEARQNIEQAISFDNENTSLKKLQNQLQ